MSSNNDNNSNDQSIDNKHFVIKAKTILKDMGVEASTSQIYELFSKLSGEKNWNVAKSKNLNFLEKIKVYFKDTNSENNKDQYSQESFDNWLLKNKKMLEVKYLEECLKNGQFDDKFCYGISQDLKDFQLVNPFEKPGALYVGSMGSGKSVAMKFTTLTHMFANSEKTVYLLYDQVKDMGDYKIMFPLQSNVIKIRKSESLIPLIETLYSEILARQVEFMRVGDVSNLKYYESIMKKNNPNFKGISRIVLVLEEFHAVMKDKELNFQYKNDVEGTAAWKLRQIIRIGRSYGVFLLAASQRFTSDDFPTTLKPAIAMQMCFRTATVADSSFMGLPNSVDIHVPGRCLAVGIEGYLQSMNIDDQISQELLKKYFKPLIAGFILISVKDLKKLE